MCWSSVVKVVLKLPSPIRRIGLQCLGIFVTPNFRNELASLHIVQSIVANFRSVRRSKNHGHLLAVLDEHPAPNHLPLVDGVKHVSVAKKNQTQGNRIRRTAVLDVDCPAKRLLIFRQSNPGKSDRVENRLLIGARPQWRQSLNNFGSVAVDDVQRSCFIAGTWLGLVNEELCDLSACRRPFRLSSATPRPEGSNSQFVQTAW